MAGGMRKVRRATKTFMSTLSSNRCRAGCLLVFCFFSLPKCDGGETRGAAEPGIRGYCAPPRCTEGKDVRKKMRRGGDRSSAGIISARPCCKRHSERGGSSRSCRHLTVENTSLSPLPFDPPREIQRVARRECLLSFYDVVEAYCEPI